jgi:hypothetical protein
MCACACAGCVPLRPRGRAAAAHQSGNQVWGRQRKLCVVVFWRTDGGTNQLKGRIQNQGSACTVWHLCTHESHAPRRHQTGCCALLLLCVAQCAQRLPEPTLEDGWPRISRSLYLPMQSPALLPASRAGGAGRGSEWGLLLAAAAMCCQAAPRAPALHTPPRIPPTRQSCPAGNT